MKRQIATGTIVSVSSNQELTAYAIDQKNVIHITQILRNLYSDPVQAVVRELVCNARDAHKEAGVTRPIEVTLPTTIDPVFKVRDFGNGLTKNEIKALLLSYGSSSDYKLENADQIGGFGIGCKCPFSITSSFQYVSYKDGLKVICNCFLDEFDCGKAAISEVENTSEPNGIEVIVPINDSISYDNFIDIVNKLFILFDTPIKITNTGTLVKSYFNDDDAFLSVPVVLDVNGEKHQVTFKFVIHPELKTDWPLGPYNVALNGLLFKIDTKLLAEHLNNLISDHGQASKIAELLNSKYSTTLPLIIEASSGFLQIAPSRESLQYSTRTYKILGECFAVLISDAFIRNIGERINLITAQGRLMDAYAILCKFWHYFYHHTELVKKLADTLVSVGRFKLGIPADNSDLPTISVVDSTLSRYLFVVDLCEASIKITQTVSPIVKSVRFAVCDIRKDNVLIRALARPHIDTDVTLNLMATKQLCIKANESGKVMFPPVLFIFTPLSKVNELISKFTTCRTQNTPTSPSHTIVFWKLLGDLGLTQEISYSYRYHRSHLLAGGICGGTKILYIVVDDSTYNELKLIHNSNNKLTRCIYDEINKTSSYVDSAILSYEHYVSEVKANASFNSQVGCGRSKKYRRNPLQNQKVILLDVSEKCFTLDGNKKQRSIIYYTPIHNYHICVTGPVSPQYKFGFNEAIYSKPLKCRILDTSDFVDIFQKYNNLFPVKEIHGIRVNQQTGLNPNKYINIWDYCLSHMDKLVVPETVILYKYAVYLKLLWELLAEAGKGNKAAALLSRSILANNKSFMYRMFNIEHYISAFKKIHGDNGDPIKSLLSLFFVVDCVEIEYIGPITRKPSWKKGLESMNKLLSYRYSILRDIYDDVKMKWVDTFTNLVRRLVKSDRREYLDTFWKNINKL